jgi:ketosteroid isomerase-like protein
MPVTLPKPIAAYFTADRGNKAAVPNCFTEDAVVVDEKLTYTGREAIRRWKAESAAKFEYVSEPIAASRDGDRTVVTARVTGTFKGSPVDLRYAFTLKGDAIARLEVVA